MEKLFSPNERHNSNIFDFDIPGTTPFTFAPSALRMEATNPSAAAAAAPASLEMASSSSSNLMAELYSHLSPQKQNVRVINAVFFCFYAPGGAKPRSGLSAMIHWGVRLFKEQYTHVECLFHFAGDPANKNNWHALSVNEKKGSGIFRHDADFYRDSRWAMYRLDIQPSQRQTMYELAIAEARRRRTYNHAAVMSTLPSVSCCVPIVRYTPGCNSCVGTGPNTVFCVELMVELMQNAFPAKWTDVKADALRPDQFMVELLRRAPVVLSMLTVDTDDHVRMGRELLQDAGADVWRPPK